MRGRNTFMAIMLPVFFAFAMLGCGRTPQEFKPVLALNKILAKFPEPPDASVTFRIEPAGDGHVVSVDYLEAVFFVKEDSVSAVNARAAEFCPELPKAPDNEAIRRAEALIQSAADETRVSDATMQGMDMTPEEAAALEKELTADSLDAEKRAKLLGYYSTNGFTSADSRKNVEKHALWFIENMPASPWAGMPEIGLDPTLNKEAYKQACALWDKYTANGNATPQLLGNAAAFFMVHDKERAERLLKRCMALEPQSPLRQKQMGSLYMFHLPMNSEKEHAEAARAAYQAYKKAMEMTASEEERELLVQNTAEAALEAGLFEETKELAARLLNDNGKHPAWDRGNAVHHGNILLGKTALRQNDTEQAGAYLLAAGKTQGSPQLNSFGPDLELAQSLLSLGKKDLVCEYLQLCGNFWEDSRIEKWIADIKDGENPRLEQIDAGGMPEVLEMLRETQTP